MPNSGAEIISLTIAITTIFLFIVGTIAVRYIFLYQKKRFRYRQEVAELHEAFNHTLLQSKLEIQEQTLDHISKELHANFSHLVSLININLAEILPQSSSETKENILETKSLAKQLLGELKALSASLNTDHIMHIGFVKALENELVRLGKLKKCEITFTKMGQEYRLPAEHEIILFRLCQEVLNNIIKYARAKSVLAVLNYTPESFDLTITDDGIGFDTEEAYRLSAEKESTGILNIKKRARLINAAIAIKSQQDKGTQVTISVPNKTN
ncbi:MAG TPA: ATP-binding protein [Chitinophagaceae bacterium]|nr:ATP-binding protein [Chitinophagaceae bacterium]